MGWKTLFWLYFDTMNPTPKSLDSLPEKEDIIQFPQKDTGNREGLNKTSASKSLKLLSVF
ncbi:MAG: hypothetical protein AUJ12_00845 [Alphaproteobacteria bacterium CG1_02_46_17]|nr:MAG: hypothetical protein AUJ12_00845 [Alphaproteobacteria bacterium CG1_02_46_17]